MSSLTLSFNDVNLTPVVHDDNQIWLTSKEIAKALGYKNSTSINKIYNANADEFTSDLTTTVDMFVQGFGGGNSKKLVRIFSLRGCYLLGMFARTDIAKRFRIWVLDVLGKEVGVPVQAPSNQLTAEQTLPLRNAVNKLVTRSGIMYPEGYKIVHQQFGVNHIKDLTLEQLAQAIEYVHDRILSLNVEKTPISSFTHNQYIKNVKSEIIDYVHLLQKIVVAGGYTLPKYPEFDKEEICQAFLVSVIKNNRMMVSFNFEGKTEMSFVPEEHAVVSRESLSSVIRFADKSQLPNIINEAVKRLGS